jgi:hypothetical protein
MKVKMSILDTRRERLAFCNPVVEWTYIFYTGSRCGGLRGNKSYKSVDKAYEAGLRMTEKLGWEVE